jgi:RNA polymerase sigma-70 factor (family 1)
LYKRYVVLLTNVAAKKVQSIETAKELVQDVFMSLYLRRDHLHTITSLKSYLFTALKNKIFSYYRKEYSQKRKNNGYHKLQIVTSNLNDEYEAKELQLQLQEKIQELPPQCKTVFLMSREEQLSHKEIAERLHISPHTVDKHIQKALRILRASFGSVMMVVLWMRGW